MKAACFVGGQAVRFDYGGQAGQWGIWNGDAGQAQGQLLCSEADAQEPDCADGAAGQPLHMTPSSQSRLAILGLRSESLSLLVIHFS